MRYKIKVRKPADTDISRDCQFPETDQDEFDIHLSALVNDISENSNIISATTSNGEIHIETSLSKSLLLEELKSLFQRDFCHVRFLEIERMHENLNNSNSDQQTNNVI